MMPQVEISELTAKRLQAIAIPLEDTYDSAFARVLDHYEKSQTTTPQLVNPGEPVKILDGGRMQFSPANPPSLSFTGVHQVVIGNNQLPAGETNWNGMLLAMIREVHRKGFDAATINSMLFVNAKVGEMVGNGYKYMPDVGLSIQGQDSNAAFRQAYQLAAFNSIKFTVFFYWQAKQKAAYSGGQGYFEL